MKPHIFVLLAVLLVVGMIAPPVSAAEYSPTGTFFLFRTTSEIPFYNILNASHDASANKMRIALIKFRVPNDAQIDFTLHYGNGSTVDGSLKNERISIFGLGPSLQTKSTITLGGYTNEYTFIDAQYEDFMLSGYGKANNDSAVTGFLAYSDDYGALDNNLAVFYPVTNISLNTIYRVTSTGTAPYDMIVTDGTPSEVAGGATKNVLDILWEWINLAISLAAFVLGFVLSIFGLLKFFFVDNLLLIVALWIGVTMAYAAISTRNIWGFYTKFFKLQRSLFQFITEMWKILIDVVSSFVSIFKI